MKIDRGSLSPDLKKYRNPLMHVNTRAIIERSTPDNVEIVVQVRNKPYEGGKWIELPAAGSRSSSPSWMPCAARCGRKPAS